MTRYEITTGHFPVLVFKAAGHSSELQVVFLEGDGKPWDASGRTPASNPTPRDALAFDLLGRTPGERYYVVRPCYFDYARNACHPDDWTRGRFSEPVVASLAEAIKTTINPDSAVVLVGYSGGGALAMLLADRIQNLLAIVTVAGLLNVESWTRHHGYLPLSGSLNPADAVVPPHVLQLHLVGLRDRIVPAKLTHAAIRNRDAGNQNILEYPSFDHVCCWRQDWKQIWTEIDNRIAAHRNVAARH